MAGQIRIHNQLEVRPSRSVINMTLAEVIAMRGTCKRKQVGCVIVKHNRVIGSGYNGSVMRGYSCQDLVCNIENKCTHAMHAEANAIASCALAGIPTYESTLYCTTAPCYDCAKLIIQAGITEVIYDGAYTNDEGIILLGRMHVKVKQLMYAE